MFIDFKSVIFNQNSGKGHNGRSNMDRNMNKNSRMSDYMKIRIIM